MSEMLDVAVIDRWPTVPEGSADAVLAVLSEACAMTADLDPDEFSTQKPSGRLVAELAEVARSATRQVGGASGASLGPASGIVVLRDLAASARALAIASAASSLPCDGDLVLRAQALLDALSITLPSAVAERPAGVTGHA